MSGKRTGPKFKMTSKDKKRNAIVSIPIVRGKSGETEDKMYIVEAILKKKNDADGVKYLIKWENWPSYTNTWEPGANIPEYMVKDFEDEFLAKQSKSAQKKLKYVKNDSDAENVDAENNNIESVINRKTAIFLLRADQLQNKIFSSILTVTRKPKMSDPSGKRFLIFVMKFEGYDDPYAVMAADAYRFFTQDVIKYFQSLITFH